MLDRDRFYSRRCKRIERVEVADFARERIVQIRRRIFASHPEANLHGFRLPALGFVREIVGPFDGSLDRLDPGRFHDQLFDARNSLSAPRTIGYELASAE